ncbi:glycoside hydrolase family 30 beta sandwich domain-containing protein [Pedobacter sp. Hv1]|uniref:glycoside hydrolase family 30 protein n=1 Tax=Pedobacter sp. Hv1 TaxID=1740090 RepID=UPI0006D88AFF|nr:glycoside hydrolase family 30 beta sandwich domain-containing protein [Pedobacter sp. Hv1]KQC02830.1 glucosylceramidase [Pedobacter sp. Hv1]
MKFFSSIFFGFAVILVSCACKKGTKTDDNKGGPTLPPVVTPVTSDVSFWLTKGDRSVLLQKQNVALNFSATNNGNTTIEVDPSQVFQTIDGFGYTLTGGSATLMNSLGTAEKDALIKELFSNEEGAIGVSYLRVSIGASDLSANVFTYNERPTGQTDINQDYFSIEAEMTDLVPILKKILAVNPNIKILGSPWTAPTWMKTNKAYKGGSLKPEYYQSYAKYFVKYIQAMKAQGITIDAITIQNEPLHPGNTPSMYMEAVDQANFIKSALGPAFQTAGLATKIIVYDHNADRPDYPMTILADPAANVYVDGSAFHLYGGNISALSTVRNAYPNKNVYFTEQWVGGPGNFAEDLKWHVSTLIVGATRNWSRNVLEWNLAADANYNPHTPDGGCTTCLGAITIAPAVSRNVAYYVIAHASKFVKPGSVRIGSTLNNTLSNVAFKTPEGKKALIVMNTSTSDQTFNIKDDGKIVTTTLPAGSAGTYVW